jgi:Ni/Co efflux regulator RcnB
MNRLLMTASAIATLAIPALSFAHAYQDQNDNRPERSQPSQARPPAKQVAPPARPANGPPSDQNRPGARPVDQNRPGVRPIDQNRPGYRPVDQNRPGYRPVDQNRPGYRPPVDYNRPGYNPTRPGYRPIDQNRPGVDRRINPSARVVQRPSWNRGNPNWWRGRTEFRSYAGRRPGFWFRPGFGYVRVNPRWYGYNWQVGGYVPFEFRSYYVQDPYEFGLPPAPYGYAYVYLDNNIALMSLATGQIVQILPNLY